MLDQLPPGATPGSLACTSAQIQAHAHKAHLNLSKLLRLLPLQQRQVAFAAAKNHVVAAAREVQRIRPQLRELQVERLLRSPHLSSCCQIRLQPHPCTLSGAAQGQRTGIAGAELDPLSAQAWACTGCICTWCMQGGMLPCNKRQLN